MTTKKTAPSDFRPGQSDGADAMMAMAVEQIILCRNAVRAAESALNLLADSGASDKEIEAAERKVQATNRRLGTAEKIRRVVQEHLDAISFGGN